MLDAQVRKANWLEKLVAPIQKLVNGTYKALGPLGTPLRDLAHGSRYGVGHPAHPAITDLPIGALTVVFVLDVVSHFNAGMPRLAAVVTLWVATVAALGAVATGYTDFAETYGHEARVAVAHGLVMSTAFVLMIISLVLRTAGHDHAHATAVILSALALAAMYFGGYLGGHLPYAIGTAVNRTAFLDGGSSKFTDVGNEADFPAGTLVKVDAAGYPVLITRTADQKLCAIASVCSHAGGPLDEGKLDGTRVTCPWHNSVFDVCSGKVIHGPATAPQPSFEVQVEGGRVKVRPSSPLH